MANLVWGAPAPVFSALSPVNPNFAFSSLGGRWVLLAFVPAPGPERDAAIQAIQAQAPLFESTERVVFIVAPDAETMAKENVGPLRWFGDVGGHIRRLYDSEDAEGRVIPRWVLIDPSQRILGWTSLDRAQQVLDQLARLGPPDNHAGVPVHAPVLIVPRVFEPSFCRSLIELYRQHGGAPSGVMREKDGRTVGVLDDFKRRRDATIADPELIGQIQARIRVRLLPQIEKAFQFKATRIERYIVACYDAGDGGYFRAHRDNTTAGTAHRKFAVSINLNAEEFEGGDLCFAEFGQKTYRPPTGGAVVFSCSLLHEATPVTRGTRYAFLPFLFDEAGATIREQNMHLLGEAAPGQPEPAPAAG